MKLYKQIVPIDASILRVTSDDFILYDADNAVVGDVIRVSEGDRVPADCVVLEVEGGEEGECVVDEG